MSAVLSFPALQPGDSLLARMETIWDLRRTVVEVTVAYTHPDDDNQRDTFKTAMTRKQAADAIRSARRQGLLVEESVTGYCISGCSRGAL